MKKVVINMKDLAEAIKRRQNKELDANIIMDGMRGAGKSTLAYKLLTKTGKFNPRRDLMFSRDDVMNAFKERKFGCIDADEMINAAHNRDFFSGDQKNFIKIMNMYRDNYNILIGSVPFFYDLDPQIRKLFKIRITIIKRGMAIVQMNKNSLYTNDPWETNINKKIEENWINKMKMGKPVKPQYNRLTTYVGHMFFTKLRPDQEKIYKELKALKRSQLNLDTDDKPLGYWEEANEFIETKRIKSFKELRFYLLGKGILYNKGLGKINRFRKDMGFEKSLKDTFRKEKNYEDDEFADENTDKNTLSQLVN